MNSKKLKYILAIAEFKSISKASNYLFISQPSLSNILSNIEKDLGIQLFDRTTNPLSLTYAGEIYIETAKKILSLENNMKKEFSDINNMKKGKITLGIPSVRGTHILPLIFPKFKDKYPGIEIDIIEGNSNLLEDHLLSGKIDLVVTSLPSDNKKIICEILYEEKIRLACKSGYLQSMGITSNNSNIISLNQLSHIDFILTQKSHRIRNLSEMLFNTYDFNPKILFQTSNTATAFRLATSGLGVCFVSEMILSTTKPTSDFDLFDIENSPIKWDIAVLYLKNTYLSTVERDFIDLLKDALTSYPHM